MVDALGNIPGRMTGVAFAMMNPVGTLQKYTRGVMRSLDDDESLRGFLRMEKWLYDQPDHAGEAARQWLEDLYQDNKLVKGELELGGKRVDLRKVRRAGAQRLCRTRPCGGTGGRARAGQLVGTQGLHRDGGPWRARRHLRRRQGAERSWHRRSATG